MKPGLGEALSAAGVEYSGVPKGDRGDQLFVTLTARTDRPLHRIGPRSYLDPGHWCEVVGSGWAWIFSDEVLHLDSVEADAEIMARCQAGYEPAVRDSSARRWRCGGRTLGIAMSCTITSTATMINSGLFTGTPGDEAKAKVTAWLAGTGHRTGSTSTTGCTTG